MASWKILASLNGLPDPGINRLPVWAAEHGTGAQKGQRIVLGAGIVDGNIPKHVLADLLRQINIDTKEVS